MRLFRLVEDVKEFDRFRTELMSASTEEVFGEGTRISDDDVTHMWEIGCVVLYAMYVDGEAAGYTLTLIGVEPCTRELVATIGSIFVKKKFRSISNLTYLFDNTMDEVSIGADRVSISIPYHSRLTKFLGRKGMSEYMVTYTKVIGD